MNRSDLVHFIPHGGSMFWLLVMNVQSIPIDWIAPPILPAQQTDRLGLLSRPFDRPSVRLPARPFVRAPARPTVRPPVRPPAVQPADGLTWNFKCPNEQI